MLALNWMAVSPAYRSRGIGSLLMSHFISHADHPDNKYECWLEGSAMGKPLYEKFGFKSLLKVAFDTDKKNASGTWRKCQHELTPAPIFAMWRPVGGLWREGNENGAERTRMPWEIESVSNVM